LTGLALVVLVLCPAIGSAQIGTADLVVRTSAGEGVPLSGVEIVVRAPATGLQRTVTTGKAAEITIRALPPGQWQVSA
jgi:hypothetical protein